MTGADHTQLVGPALASALAAKGYHTLTPVQEAVLDDALEGRDLRITSQTGSGKTIAIGFAVRDLLDDLTTQFGGVARPRVLVLTPTRELAKQVAEELAWLYAPLRVRVAAVTGGAGYIDQKRALASNPAVIVATPGRLRDALERGKIDSTALAAVVLDEADSMLDLGFREDLEAILAKLPKERRSHLVSATFSRDVVSLADRFQRDPVHVQGTVLGEANVDIEHVVHLVEPGQRVDALINLLLADEDAKSLVFVRTRADVARIAGELAEAGFVVRTLSGEMEQAERDRALAAFRQGGVQALIATDVAARGIDVRDIARVIQVEPPSNVETYTHRSGRTGRAGKQGTSVLFVAPPHYPAIARGLSRARIAHRVEPVPRPDAIQRAREEKLVAWLAREGDGDTIDPHALSIAERIVASGAVLTALARLVEKAGLHGPTKARNVRAVPPPRDEQPVRGRRPTEGRRPLPPVHSEVRRPLPANPETQRPIPHGSPETQHPLAHANPEAQSPLAHANPGSQRPLAHANPGSQRPVPPDSPEDQRPLPPGSPEGRRSPPRDGSADGRNPGRRPLPPSGDPAWVTFRVTWGGLHGADARRLLAVACRRGNIRGTDVGAIRVEAAYSLLDIARDVAGEFETQAGKPDPRDPRVRITRADEAPRVQDGSAPRVQDRPGPRVDERPAPRAKERSEAPAEEPRPRPRPRVEERPVRPHVPHRAAKPERPRQGGPRTHPEPERRQRRGGDAPVRRPRKA